MPEMLTLRLVEVCVAEKGFRVKHLWVVTTLLDTKVYPSMKQPQATLQAKLLKSSRRVGDSFPVPPLTGHGDFPHPANIDALTSSVRRLSYSKYTPNSL